MEKLYLLTDKALNELKTSINSEKYKSKDTFLEEKFVGRQYLSTLDMEVTLPDLYVKDRTIEPMWYQDFSNGKALHKCFKENGVRLRYLVDERFWVYLTHTKYWNYLQQRYPNIDEGVVRRHWFFEGGNQDFSRQSLLRLWWRVECSYDEKLEDPYELTKIAFEYADPVNQIIERKIGKSRKVFRSALIAIRDTENSEKLKNNENRTLLGKMINTIAGIKLIEVMSEEELVKMFSDQINYIVNGKKEDSTNEGI